MTARATFPDAPLTPEELRASLRGEPLNAEPQRYVFAEIWEETIEVTVYAHSEEGARELYLATADTGAGKVVDRQLINAELMRR